LSTCSIYILKLLTSSLSKSPFHARYISGSWFTTLVAAL
jgi:hypothetical protein